VATNQDLKRAIKEEQSNIRVSKGELEKSQRNLAENVRKKRVEELDLKNLETQKGALYEELKNSLNTCERWQSYAEVDDNRIMELLYERDQLNRDIIKAKDKSIKHMNIVALWDEQAKRALAQI